jgi:hypothetical protein
VRVSLALREDILHLTKNHGELLKLGIQVAQSTVSIYMVPRPEKAKATLIIAKLDRLARNVHFISGLMESGVDFVAADNPHANKLMVHLLAAFAEHEREQISQRTKDFARGG